ncbi:hypothetical protein ACQ4PT_021859 [Festuca glaucescens]
MEGVEAKLTQNDGWNGNNGFDSAQFGGDFGDFDQGYFKGGQGYGQQYASFGAIISANPSAPPQVAATVAESIPLQGQQGSAGALTEVVATAVQSVGADLAKAAKKQNKYDVLCFRCVEMGHQAVDCTATLCLCCDSAKHALADCHLHLMPKPVATMYGLCRDELLFFDVLRSSGVQSRRHSGKVGRIRVKGGTLTAHQIIKELDFLIPSNHQWDIKQTADDVFKVVYPTKEDYARIEVEGRPLQVPAGLVMQDADMDADGHVNEHNSEGDHETKHTGTEPSLEVSSKLPKANNISDTYKQNKNSSSVKWDSNVTKESSGVRSAPPAHGGVCRESSSSKLKAKSVCVQQKLPWGVRAENEEEDLPSPLARLVIQDGIKEGVCSDKEINGVPKYEFIQPASPLVLATGKRTILLVAVELLPLFSAEAKVEVLTISSTQPQGGCSPGSLTTPSQLVTEDLHKWHEATQVGASSPISAANVKSSHTVGLSSLQSKAFTDVSNKIGTGVFLGGRYSEADLIAYGGIPELKSSRVRSSSRIHDQPNSDATQLARAQQRVQARDINITRGNSSSPKFTALSIASIPSGVVVSRAVSLGVSLGSSPGKVASSVNMIKEIDLQRTLIMLKKKEEDVIECSESESNLAIQEATSLCDDLDMEEQRGSVNHKDSTISKPKGSRARKNKQVDFFPVQKSARLNKK